VRGIVSFGGRVDAVMVRLRTASVGTCYCSLPKRAAAGAQPDHPTSAATMERTVDLRADFH